MNMTHCSGSSGVVEEDPVGDLPLEAVAVEVLAPLAVVLELIRVAQLCIHV